jgi:hypothetical protein
LRVFAHAVPLIVQTLPSPEGAVPRSELPALILELAVRLRGADAVHAASVPREKVRRAAGVLGVVGGASSKAGHLANLCPDRMRLCGIVDTNF